MSVITKKIIAAPYIDQSQKYPTGCESVSAVMLLKYLGIEITVDEWIKEDLAIQNFETKNGVLYGPDPRKVFCGSPYEEDGMGCYAPVIVNTLNKVFSRKIGKANYTAIDLTGTAMEELLKSYIDHDMPVIFWACINMREPVIGPDWQLLDEPEQTFTWISNEHCMLLVGYDEEGYYFNDPYENHGLIRYPKEVVEQRHKVQYSMAVAVKIAE